MECREISMKLVPAIESDANAIKQLMVTVYESEQEKWFLGHEEDLFIPGFHLKPEQTHHMCEYKYFKIMYHGKFVGVILISTAGREEGRIERFYILPDYQSKGIGSQALTNIEALFPKITLWTLDMTQYSVRNHYFYQKNGYQLGGYDKDRYYYKKIEDTQREMSHCHNGLDYSGHHFKNCNFAKTDWYGYNISNSTFSNCNYDHSIFKNASLSNARFTEVFFQHGSIDNFRIEKEEIYNGSLCDTYVHDMNYDITKDSNITVENCIFRNSKINHCDFQNVEIEHCNFEGGKIDGILITELLECYKNSRQ